MSVKTDTGPAILHNADIRIRMLCIMLIVLLQLTSHEVVIISPAYPRFYFFLNKPYIV